MKYFKFIAIITLSICSQISFSQIQIKEQKSIELNQQISDEVQTLPKDQLQAIKENYNWKKKQFLIVNFKNLQTKCSYDIYEDVVKAYNLYEKKAFEKIDLSNCRNIFIYADKALAKPILDNKTHFEDIGLYFMKHYFNQDKTCVGVLVMNQKGEYLVKAEEYNTFTITEMMEKL